MGWQEGLLVLVLVAIVLGAPAEWIEIRTGQPVSDDLTYVGRPEGPDSIWIGTNAGEVYRTRDDGQTWEWIFSPRSFDNLLDVRLRTLRVPRLELDLLRDQRQDIDVRDRESLTRRSVDIARQARDRQREPSAKLLGILVARDVRDPPDVIQVTKCSDYLYINAKNGVWRSPDREPFDFEMMDTGQDLATGYLTWLSCDDKGVGHIAATTKKGTIVESEDFGETWHAYRNPFELASRVSFAIFLDGRLELLAHGRLYREREDARGYEPMCDTQVDTVDGTANWVWSSLGPVFGTALAGVATCQNGRVKLFGGETMALAPIYYFQTQGNTDEHVMVVTNDDIFLSHDHGQTFEQVFRRMTQRGIGLVLVSDLETFDNVLVWTGNTLWKRTPPSEWGNPGVAIAELSAEAPLSDVLESALRVAQLDGSQIAARRNDSRYQGFLPIITAAFGRHDGQVYGTVHGLVSNFPLKMTDLESLSFPNQNVWSVMATFDIADLLRSRSSTDRSWADVQRMHRRILYRVEDTYMRWLSISVALETGRHSAEQVAHMLLTQREMAAYLDYMTGGAFAAFNR